MTPEESLERVLRAAGLEGGHWPYTRSADVFAGWRPAEDSVPERPSGRRVRIRVTYDIVLCHRRGAQKKAEAARFALYRALETAGWTLCDTGPEVYTAQTEMFYWPVTAARGFGLDADGQPYDLTDRGDAHE